MVINSDEKTIEAKGAEKREFVEVRHNGDIWDINYAGRGKFSVFKGQTVKFNIHNRHELRALLSVVKEINSPRGNNRTHMEKKGGMVEYKTVARFEFVEGKERLPEILQKLNYSSSGIPLDEERDAILELCPDYFEKK